MPDARRPCSGNGIPHLRREITYGTHCLAQGLGLHFLCDADCSPHLHLHFNLHLHLVTAPPSALGNTPPPPHPLAPTKSRSFAFSHSLHALSAPTPKRPARPPPFNHTSESSHGFGARYGSGKARAGVVRVVAVFPRRGSSPTTRPSPYMRLHNKAAYPTPACFPLPLPRLYKSTQNVRVRVNRFLGIWVFAAWHRVKEIALFVNAAVKYSLAYGYSLREGGR